MILVKIADIHVKKIKKLWNLINGDRNSVENTWTNFT